MVKSGCPQRRLHRFMVGRWCGAAGRTVRANPKISVVHWQAFVKHSRRDWRSFLVGPFHRLDGCAHYSLDENLPGVRNRSWRRNILLAPAALRRWSRRHRRCLPSSPPAECCGPLRVPSDHGSGAQSSGRCTVLQAPMQALRRLRRHSIVRCGMGTTNRGVCLTRTPGLHLPGWQSRPVVDRGPD